MTIIQTDQHAYKPSGTHTGEQRGRSLRIQVISDLHLELTPNAELGPSDVAADADIVLVPGDIARAPDTIRVVAEMFRDVPLVVVAGNHEAYLTGLTIIEGLDKMRLAASGYASAECRPIHVLENEEVIIHICNVPVRLIGSTLWTNLDLFGDPVRERMIVERGLNDFRAIKGSWNSPLGQYLGGGSTPFRTSEWLDMHDASVAYLHSRLTETHDGPTIVMTHHLPSLRSVAPRFKQSLLSSGFASSLDDLVGLGATLWAHGHTHDSCLWRTSNGTLVACNPAGYAQYTSSGAIVLENPRFDPKFVIDISWNEEKRMWWAERDGVSSATFTA